MTWRHVIIEFLHVAGFLIGISIDGNATAVCLLMLGIYKLCAPCVKDMCNS